MSFFQSLVALQGVLLVLLLLGFAGLQRRLTLLEMGLDRDGSGPSDHVGLQLALPERVASRLESPETLVLFLSASCSGCRQAARSLAEPNGPSLDYLNIVVLWRGSVPGWWDRDCRDGIERRSPAALLSEPASTAFTELAISSTPFGVHLKDRTIDRATLISGPESLEYLSAQAANQPSRATTSTQTFSGGSK